jgi:hypothetical protein
MPASAPGNAEMIMSGSSQDWSNVGDGLPKLVVVFLDRSGR